MRDREDGKFNTIMSGKKDALADLLEKTRLNRVAKRLPSPSGLLVLNYHRVGNAEASPLDRGVWSATEEEFDAQMRWLAKQSDVVGIDDLEDLFTGRCRGRFVLVTFDDGYRDNYEIAWPILKAHGITATFFVTSGFLDQRRIAWWDEIAWMVRHAQVGELPPLKWNRSGLSLEGANREGAIHRLLSIYKQLPLAETIPFLNEIAEATQAGRAPESVADSTWMTWEMIRQMRASGMGIGGHTVTHPVLSSLDAEAQFSEVMESKSRIEAELGETITAFSYPVGQPDSFTHETVLALKKAGYRWAFSFYGSYVKTVAGAVKADAYDIPRVAVEPNLSAARFHSMLAVRRLFA